MEIKVLGTGCSSCKALYETTKQAISELGCDATLIKEEDLLKIMEYKVIPCRSERVDNQIKMNYEKVILSTDCNAGLSFLW